MFAALRGHTDCVRLLLNAGADRRAHDNVRANATIQFTSFDCHDIHFEDRVDNYEPKTVDLSLDCFFSENYLFAQVSFAAIFFV